MTSIAARLTSVVSSLDDESHTGFDTGALGHHEAVSALEGFISGWSHGRSEISTGVSTVHQNLVGSAANYTNVDRAEQASFAGGAKGSAT